MARRTLFIGLLCMLGLILAACPSDPTEPPDPPEVTNTQPDDGDTDVPLDTTIEVTFSTAMNESATQGAFSADPNIDCDFAFEDGSTRLICTPQGELEPDTEYTITIATDAEDQDGNTLENDVTFSFTTEDPVVPDPDDPPEVTDTQPADGAADVALNADIRMTFSKAMNQSATQDAFSANPNIDCDFSWNPSSTVLTCSPTSNLTQNTSYEITVDTDAEDQDGNNLESEVSFSFTTGDTTLETCVFDDSEFDNCVLD